MKRVLSGRAAEILLVEDNPGDIDLVLDVLSDSSTKTRVSVVNDGMEAMAFLRKQEPYRSSPEPDLILLDLNLPKKDGREVLAEVKADLGLRHIPVVVLTSSEASRDLMQTYRLQANCFVTKPVDLADFFEAVKAIEHFWLHIAHLPQAN